MAKNKGMENKKIVIETRSGYEHTQRHAHSVTNQKTKTEGCVSAGYRVVRQKERNALKETKMYAFALLFSCDPDYDHDPAH